MREVVKAASEATSSTRSHAAHAHSHDSHTEHGHSHEHDEHQAVSWLSWQRPGGWSLRASTLCTAKSGGKSHNGRRASQPASFTVLYFCIRVP